MYKKKILSALVLISVAGIILLLLFKDSDLKIKPDSQDKTLPISSSEVREPITEQVANESIEISFSPTPKQSDLGGLDDEMVDYISEKADNLLDFPILPGRVTLQEKIRHETFEDTFENLTDNDNFATLIPSMGGNPFSPGTYESDVMIVSKMTRVRKLLADARNNPQKVASFLMQELDKLTDEFPRQYQQFIEENNSEPPEGRNFPELPDYMKNSIHSSTAIYLLSQIGNADTLPFLAQLYVKTKGQKSSLPVDSKFLFIAMHRLVQKSQGQELNNQMKQIRDSYLRKAKRVEIQSIKEVEVAKWDAYYHEDDFRRKLPGNRVDLSMSPKMNLERFPSLENLNNRQVHSLMKELSKFAAI